MLFRNVNLCVSWQPGDRDTNRECGRVDTASGALGMQCPVRKAALPSQHPSTTQHSHCPAGHSYLVKAADKGHDEIHSVL